MKNDFSFAGHILGIEGTTKYKWMYETRVERIDSLYEYPDRHAAFNSLARFVFEKMTGHDLWRESDQKGAKNDNGRDTVAYVNDR